MPAVSAKYVLPLFYSFLTTVFLSAQPPGYYSSAEGLAGIALQQALHDIIDNHTVLSYDDLPVYFRKTDKKADGTVWDMYSDIPGSTPFYFYNFNQDECGNYSQEGDCFNREHSFPRSWFNDLSPMYSDLFHIYPTDGWVNNKRGNYPYGVTTSPAWTSTNGSRLGPSSYPGYTGIIFEPVNDYKGDFARTYFYMAVRYFGEDAGWTGSDMVTGSQLKSWALQMLMEWDQNDPVGKKEKDRNDSVFVLQGNRNPFIDNPAYSGMIWGTQSGIGNTFKNTPVKVWPVPAKEFLTIGLVEKVSKSCDIKIVDISGRLILHQIILTYPVRINVSDMEPGFYVLIVNTGNEVITARIIVMH